MNPLLLQIDLFSHVHNIQDFIPWLQLNFNGGSNSELLNNLWPRPTHHSSLFLLLKPNGSPILPRPDWNAGFLRRGFPLLPSEWNALHVWRRRRSPFLRRELVSRPPTDGADGCLEAAEGLQELPHSPEIGRFRRCGRGTLVTPLLPSSGLVLFFYWHDLKWGWAGWIEGGGL